MDDNLITLNKVTVGELLRELSTFPHDKELIILIEGQEIPIDYTPTGIMDGKYEKEVVIFITPKEHKGSI